MKLNLSSLPSTRNKFTSNWDELEYLYDKLIYWLYNKNNRSASKRFATKLKFVIRKIPNIYETIKGNECMAIINEVQRDWQQAIEYRKKEIELIQKLREISKDEKPMAKKRILADFKPQDLADRYDLLAIALWENSQLEEALSALETSEKICIAGGFEFDGKDIRKDIKFELEKIKLKTRK